jgi:lantibiotic modifying enzyme
MTATAAEFGSAAATALAATCAGRLAELVERTDGRCVSQDDLVSPGFAAGPAGVGWALVQFAAAGGAPRYRQAGQCALRCSGGLIATAREDGPDGWCRGTAGLLIAGSCIAGDGSRPSVKRASQVLAERPVLQDFSLCHGELGITEALTVLAATGCDPAAAQALRRRAGLILDAIGRRAWHCGTPGGISTPGLLSGLAGIGYGLLRLGFPDQTPSVLLLEPTADHPATVSPSGLNGI